LEGGAIFFFILWIRPPPRILTPQPIWRQITVFDRIEFCTQENHA